MFSVASRTHPRRLEDPVSFPANPFVALSDFTVVILLVVILGYVYQSANSSEMIRRRAITAANKRLKDDLRKTVVNSALPQASWATLIAEQTEKSVDVPGQKGIKRKKMVPANVFEDGDLIRLRLPGAMLYQDSPKAGAPPPTTLTPAGKELILRFADVIAMEQGKLPGAINPRDKSSASYNENRLFKRIEIEGHADRSEGDDNRVWELSLTRARTVAQLLQKQGIAPGLLVPTGRGCWEQRRIPIGNWGQKPDAQEIARCLIENRRVEIVIVYSAEQVYQYNRSQNR